MKLILSCHFWTHSTCAFWSCSIAKSCLFHSLAMSSLDSLENKYELPVKPRALAKTPPISIAMLAILDIDVFQQDFLFDEVLSGDL